MSNRLYAWEFGANFGHIGALLPLARAFRQRGHAALWAVSQTGPAARTLGIPVVPFCTGFFAPPKQRPRPSLRPWQALPPVNWN